MKFRLLRLMATALGCALLLGRVVAAPDKFSGVPASVQPFTEHGDISGAVMLVASKDRVLHLSAVGQSDIATGRKMRTDDFFWIASMTKPMAAVCLAMLVDDGKITFDDQVEKYLPEFKHQSLVEEQPPERRVLVKAVRPITLRDLLTHTSGMGEYVVTDPHWTLAEMSKVVAREPLRFPPGSHWGYSTAGIDVLGRVIEVVSGLPFDAFMQERLFNPLQMKHSAFWLTPEQERSFAHNYRTDPKSGKLEEAPIKYLYGGAISDRARPPLGGAGLFSTTEDVAKFYQMMLNGGEWGGRRILKTGTVAEMTRKQTGDLRARPGIGWGLGFNVIEDPRQMEANSTLTPGSFGHGGAHGTNSWADPARGLIYVFMIQQAGLNNADDSEMRRAYQSAVEHALKP
ncbi:MAG: class A beta-lactamase-related serine hydrolase [Opitutus sp.]|nr:class A beta-lactamase-related serine hydrolase [Opitutus sp.]